MPPQRRKIVPPATTSKARKKVAGSNRKTEQDSAVSDSAVSDSAVSDSAAPVGPTATTDGAASVDLEKPAPKAEPAPKTEPVEKSEPSVTTEPAAKTNWTPVIAVGGVAVVLAAFAVVAAFEPGAGGDNAAWVDQGATSEVTRAATDAVTTLYTYSDATIDEDFDKARAVLNPDMLAEFDRVADTTKSAVQQTQTATQADVSDLGVTRLEDDKAEILAVLNVSATQGGVAQGNAEGPILVNMEKVDGKWILSGISDQ